MLLSELVQAQRSIDNAVTEGATILFQEEAPYIPGKSLSGAKLYNWTDTFLFKLEDAFVTDIVGSMGQREIDVFKAYTRKNIYTVADVKDKAALALDKFLATL